MKPETPLFIKEGNLYTPNKKQQNKLISKYLQK